MQPWKLFEFSAISTLASYKLVSDKKERIRQHTIKKPIKNFPFLSIMINEVRYNWTAHRSAQLFIITISSHNHIKRKQPQRIFLHCSSSVTIIKIVKKYL